MNTIPPFGPLTETELTNPEARYNRAKKELGSTALFSTQAELHYFADVIAKRQLGEHIVPSSLAWVEKVERMLADDPGVSAARVKATWAKTLEDIDASEKAIAASTAATLKALSLQRTAIGQAERPLGLMKEQHVALVAKIASARRYHAFYSEKAEEFRGLLDSVFGTEDISGNQTHSVMALFTNINFCVARESARVASELGRFLAAREAELPPLEQKMIDYARSTALEAQLPADLSARAA